MSNVRVALIGCGSRGKGHFRILQTFDDVELAALCDPVDESREAAAQEFGIETQYTSVDDLLDAGIDAVIVATPPHLNGKVALPCIERGVHTLIEKPPGMTVEETKGLKAAADKSGAKVIIGWNRRFHPVIVQAREQVLERGPITQLVGEFHKSITRLADSGIFGRDMLDQMLLETPIHSIDTIRYLAGSEVSEVHSIVRRSMGTYRDVHAALVGFENGAVAQLIHNYTTDARLERYEIHGHDISAYMEGVSGGEVFVHGESHPIEKGPTGGTEEQDRYFIDCIKHDRPIGLPAADLAEAVKTMELAEQILGGTK